MTFLPDKNNTDRLSLKEKFAYALPALSLALVGIPVYVLLPKFYTDTMGLSISVVGVLLMSVRVFDALTDPFIGYLSDRTSSRFGRRKPLDLWLRPSFLAPTVVHDLPKYSFPATIYDLANKNSLFCHFSRY